MPTVPQNVRSHSRDVLTDIEDRTFFDYNAWQTFIGLIWPTDPTSFYAKPFFFPRGLGQKPDASQPQSVQKAYERAQKNAEQAYPRWSGLPIPQVGALNPILETYFQNPAGDHPVENTSCMGCHYSASDLGYVWSFKLGTWPQPYNQGRVNPEDTKKASVPAN